MNYPNLTLTTSDLSLYSINKNGDLANCYLPLQNLITLDGIGDFTTTNLNFDKNTPIDILVTDEYDGSENLILNDDINKPKLINTRLSVLENNTFEIPKHLGNSVTNVYDNSAFDNHTNLLKLYDVIPSLQFNGLRDGGSFACGSYIFYFKFTDADGNMTNIALESGIVQVHIGDTGTIKIRMGMEEENSNKCIKFTLSNIDAGFDFVKVFYERTSTDNGQLLVDNYFMITLNFPITNNKCELTLTGKEETIQISKSDLLTEYADIQTAKTQEVLQNILFLGNVSAYEQNYADLQKISWQIIPSEVTTQNIGGIDAQYNIQSNDNSIYSGCYYNMQNVYYNIGYWPDEYYRFGIVYIYDNNVLSPVFNIQGVDFSKISNVQNTWFYKTGTEWWETEPENFIFHKEYMSNSKGVVKFSQKQILNIEDEILLPKLLGIKFDFLHMELNGKRYLDIFKLYHIKGFFFVRQKRIPSILAQGLVVGLTGKDHGCIPVLQSESGTYITKSFLGKDRLLHSVGEDIVVTSKVLNQALLIPDFELLEATYNLIFTGQEFSISRIGTISQVKKILHLYTFNSFSALQSISDISKLVAIPKGTYLKTDGENYFSTIAGNASEPYKTENINQVWDKTVPQELTVSTDLIRGEWGSYVGMSSTKFNYGDIVNIKSANFIKNANQNELEFEDRFKDLSFYSAISPRYNATDTYEYTCFRGDCIPSMYTHRMMNNFIDPELPTNTKIVDPACWCKNYAVRCTTEILSTTHSNLTGDAGGWYIPSPIERKSALLSLVFGILTGNLGQAIEAAESLEKERKILQDTFNNEIVLAFEVYTGASKDSDDDWYTMGEYDTDSNLENVVKAGHIKKVNPQELENNSVGSALKNIFKADDKWELHGLSSINRADVNAVSIGQWVTFPICSSLNLALRDIDYTQATEETKFNKKRSFYPLEDMDIKNHLPESNRINGATRRTISSNGRAAFNTVPFIKQEYFNRIYYSKPNVAQTFINSYRMIFANQYKDYNKEFGSITKLVAVGNNLFVIFDHGIGMLTPNRTPLTDTEKSNYLPSNSVITELLTIISEDYGSMWKDSIIRTPNYHMVYGVDTVAKKIWKLNSEGVEFISDHKFNKFLNKFLKFSEYDFKEYVGHINIKTHYNEFKHDVIFTFYKDIPEYDENHLIVKWNPGVTWSLCYNEITKSFVTFYDWIPVESANIDNVWFSFDKDLIELVYNKELISTDYNLISSSSIQNLKCELNINKLFLDKAFSEKTKVYYINAGLSTTLTIPSHLYLSLYISGNIVTTNNITTVCSESYGYDTTWKYILLYNAGSNSETVSCSGKLSEIKLYNSTVTNEYFINDIFPYYKGRALTLNNMYLWKHGQAGLYDNQGKLTPTKWYGKQHEFNFEFVVVDKPILKIFNNLLLISNKTTPSKFEYEVVGEGYEWFEYKPIIEWINNLIPDPNDPDKWWKIVLGKTAKLLQVTYLDFPDFGIDNERLIQKLPYLKLKLSDKKGTPERPIYNWELNPVPDIWSTLSNNPKTDRYSYNCNETCLTVDEQLNELSVHTEQLGNDMKKYGRLRGNMEYLEDTWKVEIRPIKFKWCYLNNNQLSFKTVETRHRDKYIKIKVRYSGEDLALIQLIITLFDYSLA